MHSNISRNDQTFKASEVSQEVKIDINLRDKNSLKNKEEYVNNISIARTP